MMRFVSIGFIIACLFFNSAPSFAADYILIPDGQREDHYVPLRPSERPVWRTHTTNDRPFWMVYSTDRKNLIKWGCTNCQVNAIRIEQRNRGYKTPWTPEELIDPTLWEFFKRNNIENNWPQKLKEAEEWLGINKPYLGKK